MSCRAPPRRCPGRMAGAGPLRRRGRVRSEHACHRRRRGRSLCCAGGRDGSAPRAGGLAGAHSGRRAAGCRRLRGAPAARPAHPAARRGRARVARRCRGGARRGRQLDIRASRLPPWGTDGMRWSAAMQGCQRSFPALHRQFSHGSGHRVDQGYWQVLRGLRIAQPICEVNRPGSNGESIPCKDQSHGTSVDADGIGSPTRPQPMITRCVQLPGLQPEAGHPVPAHSWRSAHLWRAAS